MIIVRLCSKSGFSSKKVAKHHSQSIAKVSKATFRFRTGRAGTRMSFASTVNLAYPSLQFRCLALTSGVLILKLLEPCVWRGWLPECPTPWDLQTLKPSHFQLFSPQFPSDASSESPWSSHPRRRSIQARRTRCIGCKGRRPPRLWRPARPRQRRPYATQA